MNIHPTLHRIIPIPSLHKNSISRWYLTRINIQPLPSSPSLQRATSIHPSGIGMKNGKCEGRTRNHLHIPQGDLFMHPWITTQLSLLIIILYCTVLSSVLYSLTTRLHERIPELSILIEDPCSSISSIMGDEIMMIQ